MGFYSSGDEDDLAGQLALAHSEVVDVRTNGNGSGPVEDVAGEV